MSDSNTFAGMEPASHTDPTAKPRRRRLWLACLVLFVCGILIGSVCTGLFVRQRIRAVMHGGPEVMRHMLIDHLDRRLDFTPAQRREVERVFAEAHGELMGLRREHQPQIDAITQRAINELAAHLDTGQHNKLEIIYAAAHKHWEISNRAGASKTLPDVGSTPRQDGSH